MKKEKIIEQWAKECHSAGLTDVKTLMKAKLAVNTFDDTGDAMKVLIETGAIYNKSVLQLLVTIGGYLVA